MEINTSFTAAENHLNNHIAGYTLPIDAETFFNSIIEMVEFEVTLDTIAFDD